MDTSLKIWYKFKLCLRKSFRRSWIVIVPSWRSGKTVVPLEELQSCLVMKRIKDNPRKLNCQVPMLQLLFDLPSHTTLHYTNYKFINYEVTEKKCFHPPPLPHFQSSSAVPEKQAKKQGKPKRRKEERKNKRNSRETQSLRRRKNSLIDQK